MIHQSHSAGWFDAIANVIIWSLAAFNKVICGIIVYWVSIIFHHTMTIDLSKLYFDLQMVAIVLAIFVSFCTGAKYTYNFVMWVKKRNGESEIRPLKKKTRKK